MLVELPRLKGLQQLKGDFSHSLGVWVFPNNVSWLQRRQLTHSTPAGMRGFRKEIWHKNEVWASNSENYRHAFFGRDSIEAAEDLLPFDTHFARSVILNLGALQGQAFNPTTEEEPGKIIHEFRQKSSRHPLATQEIFQRLHSTWGEEGHKYVNYYGSADATPLYIRLVADYCQQVGDTKILNSKILQKDGQERTIREVVWNALQWTQKRIEEGPLNHDGEPAEPHPPERIKLLEFKRTNGQGIDNQNWKDSGTSLIHLDGTLVNHTYPIATIELQGLAFDALMKGSSLFTTDKGKLQSIASMQHLAQEVQTNMCANFWMPGKEYFAVALDRDENGQYRQVQTMESNAAELLNTGIFDTIPEGARQRYISGIVTTIYSPDFMTSVGVRCRSVAHEGLVDYWDYHGSHAVWPKETYDIAKGLLRQGFPDLAKQLLYRMRNGMIVERSFAELFYVDTNGTVAYNPTKLSDDTKQYDTVIITTSIPEDKQTWSWSAFVGSKLLLKERVPQSKNTWQYDLEQSLLQALPLISELPFEKAKGIRRTCYVIDQKAGFERERTFKERAKSAV